MQRLDEQRKSWVNRESKSWVDEVGIRKTYGEKHDTSCRRVEKGWGEEKARDAAAVELQRRLKSHYAGLKP